MYTPTKIHASKRGIQKILGELESHVLEALWRLGEGAVTKVKEDVTRTYKAISYNAVMTVLNRMVEKDLVEKKKKENVFQYSAKVSREELEQSVASTMLRSLVHDPALFAAAKFEGMAGGIDEKTLAKLKDFIAQSEQ